MIREQLLNPTNTILKKKKKMEDSGIDPGASCMQSTRSTIWANSPIQVR